MCSNLSMPMRRFRSNLVPTRDRFDRRAMRFMDEVSLLTLDGVRASVGLRVTHATRGQGTVLRIVKPETGVIVRWDIEVPEPAKTTMVAVGQLSALRLAA